ncbi:MAG: HlyC/CorC family transporter [Candidatus Marinimicrobia bacterium]|nr:HlyC/CorC family transporter [Candidatus Neomarinimicrobiota bacterium]MBT3633442.1 HlyC/CorC family transporter [Candidatus Neomarinimicrobiota bacterium]MBT3681585.1 HlyC/CorC family transporter [Candidatus Neomarinimicrobiota bacterium]MBT3758448.1 HlyC/CorC family transporter [Candidatus Neomarinimicrobiota bacterium]MBT3894898.1 HlyC/CorC family transporter [Candidatus Neomarinimicrobiota bacterium]
MLVISLAILGLVFSIFFSSTEMALISANKLQIKVWLKQKKRGARLAIAIIQRKEEYLSSILIGTNLSNILATSFATVYLTKQNYHPVVIITIIAFIILLIGEILPKAITREFSNSTLLLVAPLLYIFGIIFSPVNRILRKTGWVSTAISEKSLEDKIAIERDDLQNVYEQIDHTSLEKEQQEMISNVFEFSEADVQDAMTPRTDISAVEINTTIPEVKQMFIDSGHSKLPVFKDDLDHIIGVIHLYDLFKTPDNIQEILKPVHHVPFSKAATTTLSEFQTAYHSIAIVHDEYGGTAGLVTAEDLFEELFGDFEDEFDEDSGTFEKLKDGSIVVNGKVEWEIFNEQFGEIIPEGNYESMAGYIIHAAGRIPNKGEKLYLPIGLVTIRKATARRIDQISILLNA